MYIQYVTATGFIQAIVNSQSEPVDHPDGISQLQVPDGTPWIGMTVDITQNPPVLIQSS